MTTTIPDTPNTPGVLFTPFATGIRFPEGPAFDSYGNLFVCARRDGQIVKITPEGRVELFVDTGGKPNGLAIDLNNRLYVADAARKEILIVDLHGNISVFVPTYHNGEKLIGPNDLCFGKSSALYFTDPGLELGPRNGKIYQYKIDQMRLTCLATDLAFPNGLAVTEDEKTLYFVESVTCDLQAIDLTEPLRRRSKHIAHLGHHAVPDGMTWLDDHHLIIALRETGELAVICTKTRIQKNINLPSGSHPTNVERKGAMFYITEDTSESVLSCRVVYV